MTIREANERKAKMIEMHNNGFSYVEIGEAFNLSRQRVFQIIGAQTRYRIKAISPTECIYPKLRKWMNDNGITRAELGRMVFNNNHPQSHTNVGIFLKGRSKDIRKSTIDKYLSVTGLTYEELFETEGD